VIVASSLGAAGALLRITVADVHYSLASPVVGAHGTHQARRIVYVMVDTEQGRGIGELACVDLPAWGDPSTEQCLAHLVNHAIPRVMAAAASRLDGALASFSVSSVLGTNRLDLACASVIEMALLDAELRNASLSLGGWLGVTASHVARGVTVGGSTLHEIAHNAEQAMSHGAARLRAKVSPGRAFATAEVLRDCGGDEVTIHLDANGSFDRSVASLDVLASLESVSITCLEQPLAGNDLAAVASLRSLMATPICLDESVTSIRSIKDVARYEAAQGVCIKPVRFGGIRGALGAITQASLSGLACFVGGMFESSLGRSVVQALAGLEEVTWISDTAPASSYLQGVDDENSAADGPLELWSHPGIGPWPEVQKLQHIAEFVAVDS
jgi:o-succinylbenzoate synthase